MIKITKRDTIKHYNYVEKQQKMKNDDNLKKYNQFIKELEIDLQDESKFFKNLLLEKKHEWWLTEKEVKNENRN